MNDRSQKMEDPAPVERKVITIEILCSNIRTPMYVYIQEQKKQS